MAIFIVYEDTTGNDSGADLDDRGDITLKAKRSFNITSDTTGVDAVSAKAQLQIGGQIPVEGFSHPENTLLVCQNVSVIRKSPIFYTATASYKSRKLPQGEDAQNEVPYPWDVPAKLSTRSVRGEAEVDEWFDGTAIVNPGTEEPVQGITRKITDVLVVIKRSFLVFAAPTIRTFMDKTNSDSYVGFSPGEGMIESISAEESTHDGIGYHDVTAEVLFRTPYRTTSANAWYYRRVVKGYYEVKTIDGEEKVVPARDEEKNTVSQPVLLDASGYRIEPGGAPFFEEKQLYGSIAFANMGFFT